MFRLPVAEKKYVGAPAGIFSTHPVPGTGVYQTASWAEAVNSARRRGQCDRVRWQVPVLSHTPW